MRPPRTADRARRRRVARIAAGLVLTIGAVALTDGARGAAGAAASSIAVAERSVRVDVASWRAAPAAPGAAHLGMPYAPDWTTSGGDAVGVLDVVNVGGTTLTTQDIVARDASSGGAPPGRVAVTLCVGGVWNASGTTCPGTVVELGDASAGPLATGVALEPAARLSVRLETRRNVVARSRLEVDVEVSRAAVRAPVATSG